ncbi:antibiotic biosynthesis monooxygenase [Bradyrhizobium sp. NP1]|uniref:putative quinol monooxygenase n=1 Tax=Bradyrhizobium sp. NP1 TaxID=3049772 RepID=UPI0025A5EBE6|nr:antibiotic biosynthesis monooxygenase [Bradyrhizobium sp. NP1]WJR79937.1 antibiotic biosynthesis monooxygenase [Bradyrhizobium sp. NP1]
MRSQAIILAAMALLTTPSLAASDSQAERVYVVTYVELLPSQSDAGAGLLIAYRNAGRGEHGNLRLEVLSELGRPARFALLETWDNKASLDAHESGPGAHEFRAKFEKIAAAPPDERILSGLRVSADEGRSGTLYVLTHVDVAPQYADSATALLQTLFDATSKEDGNAAHEVLRQANRPNHFTTVEQWKDEPARARHSAAAPTREFRQKLSPMMGALYDERIYRLAGK